MQEALTSVPQRTLGALTLLGGLKRALHMPLKQGVAKGFCTSLK